MHACTPTILNVYPALARQPLYAFSLHGGLGVPIFFCISGFCITNAAAVLLNRANGWRSFIYARVRRIYPPYIFATLLVLGLTLLVTFAARHHLVASSVRAQMDLAGQGPAFVFASLLFLNVPLHQLSLIGPAWSLDYEVVFYAIILVALVLVGRASARPQHMTNMLHGLTIACLAVAIASPGWAVFPFNYWPQFGIGVLLYDLLANPTSKRPLIFGALILAGITAYLALHNVPADKVGENSTISLYVACLVVAIFVWQTYRFEAIFHKFVLVRWLSRVGVFSYSLYLTHEPIEGLVLQVAKRAHLVTQGKYLLVFGLQVVVAVAVGYAFYRVCEAPFVSKRAKAIHAASV